VEPVVDVWSRWLMWEIYRWVFVLGLMLRTGLGAHDKFQRVLFGFGCAGGEMLSGS